MTLERQLYYINTYISALCADGIISECLAAEWRTRLLNALPDLAARFEEDGNA